MALAQVVNDAEPCRHAATTRDGNGGPVRSVQIFSAWKAAVLPRTATETE